MSKKFKHKPPHNGDPLLRIENQALRTKYEVLSKEHETLRTALRMLTSTDKDTLLNAVVRVESLTKLDWAAPRATTPYDASHTHTIVIGGTA